MDNFQFLIKNNDNHFYCNIPITKMKTISKYDPSLKNNIGLILIHDVTQCNGIFIYSNNNEYPYIHAIHATPGSFGENIDGTEIGIEKCNINDFINKINHNINKTITNKKININICIVGKNLNTKRKIFLEKEFKKNKAIKTINIKLFDAGYEFEITNWNCCNINLGEDGSKILINKQIHKYMDIEYYLPPINGIKIKGWDSKKEISKWFYLD